jgi:hypothetical protein
MRAIFLSPFIGLILVSSIQSVTTRIEDGQIVEFVCDADVIRVKPARSATPEQRERHISGFRTASPETANFL